MAVSLSEPRKEIIPPILRDGFRVFFPLTALYAIVALAAWILILTGHVLPPLALDPLSWHIHEMLFGTIGAAVAGFLLTAVPNWTGVPGPRGVRLAALAGLWLAGRIAVTFGAAMPAWVVGVLDLSFLVALGAVVGRAIVVSGNRRNLPVIALVVAYAGANLLYHLGWPDLGMRLGLMTVVLLIALIGGRVVPGFTGNWIKRAGQAVGPRPFGHPDRVALALTLAGGLAYLARPEHPGTGAVVLTAGLAHAIRQIGWRGHRTLGEPLVWVLHLGYLWLSAGVILLGLSILWPAVPSAVALHALTAGAMATMILAIMTRATLGHSGRDLKAGPATTAIYILVTLAALSRLGAGWEPVLLHPSALAWGLAFAIYLAVYLPICLKPRAV